MIQIPLLYHKSEVNRTKRNKEYAAAELGTFLMKNEMVRVIISFNMSFNSCSAQVNFMIFAVLEKHPREAWNFAGRN